MRTFLLLLVACLYGGAAFAQSVGGAPAATGSTQPVVVEGVVPDEAAKATILSKVREQYGNDRVVDRLRVDSVVAPANWAQNVAKLVGPGLKQVSAGQLAVNGNSVSIRGQVGNEMQRQQIASQLLTSLNATYVVNADGLKVMSSPQNLLDEALANRIVEFESGSATLTPMGQQVLDALLEPMRQVGSRRVQVIGHTDNVGQRQSNVALSKARAEAVRNYFQSRGISIASVSVLGVGPDQPIADNATPEGRARNRRIQFKVL